MIDVIKALLGERFCPWCKPWSDTYSWYERVVVDHTPRWVYWLIVYHYDSLVGKIGLRIHRRHP